MEGVEPPTLWFVAIDSNPLSYIPFFAGKALGEKAAEGRPLDQAGEVPVRLYRQVNRRTTGIEPAYDGATNHYLTTW